ncbi:MAG: hypothetical protein IJM97_03120 [Clostridia bacterium]|nr:hypothetical protein [Clostridia bacterium]
MRKFDITYFFGPTAEYVVTDKCVADIKDSGITLTQLCCDTETNKKALEVMKKYGLRADVCDPRISKIFLEKDFENADEAVKSVVEDYKDFDNIEGWHITDEPSSDEFPILKAIVDAFRRYSPEKETDINLFPMYAKLGNELADTSYTAHLEHFAEIVNPHHISYDHYHFFGRANTPEEAEDVSERERLIFEAAKKYEGRSGFFENAEEIRRVGLKYDIPQMLIVLLVEHGDYRNLTFGELSWEVNMSLAYGFRRISYFTYWLPSGEEHRAARWRWDNSMCDAEGNKFRHYYDVQKINRTIAPVGEILFDKKSLEVFHIGELETGTRAFESFGGINKIDGNNAVIGFFEDGLIYLVNRDFTNENTFTVHTDKKLSAYKDGSFESVGNDYIVNLKAGEAVLLKID